MEELYKKLHDKYTTLKRKGFSELDEIGKDQEVKFLEYVSVSEEVIQHLQGEKDRLSGEVSNLRDEAASIRSKRISICLRSVKDGECAEYKKLLMEEKQTNNMLSEEIERLQKLLQERSCSFVAFLDDSVPSKKARFNSIEVPSDSTLSMTRKRSREGNGSSGHEDDLVRESPRGSSKAIIHISRDLLADDLPECCKISVDQTDITEKGPTYCHFQALVEYLVGMKLSEVNKTSRTSISALHQSSGYSFSLTWVNNASNNEPELLYRVLTLGTFEAVAPEWMRSTLMFRVSMCPIFFGRVSRVMRLQC